MTSGVRHAPRIHHARYLAVAGPRALFALALLTAEPSVAQEDEVSCLANGRSMCGDACVDFATSPLHCGGCFRPCLEGQSCVGSACQDGADCRTLGCALGSWCEHSARRCVEGCHADSDCGAEQLCDTSIRHCVSRAPQRERRPAAQGPARYRELLCEKGSLACRGACAWCPTVGASKVGCQEDRCVARACLEGYHLCDDACCQDAAPPRASPPLRTGETNKAPASMGSSRTSGIRLGRWTLRPFFDLEGQFDSAVGFIGGSRIRPRPTGEFIARLRPGMALGTSSVKELIQLTGSLDYFYYTGLFTRRSNELSRLEADGLVLLDWNRSQAMGIVVSNHFRRSDSTTNVASPTPLVSVLNETGLAIPIRFGGGVLEFVPTGVLTIESFEPLVPGTIPACAAEDLACQRQSTEAMRYGDVLLGLKASWLFLPKTRLALSSTLELREYGLAVMPPGRFFKTTAELSGLLSQRVGLLARLGWGRDLRVGGVAAVTGTLLFSYVRDLWRAEAGYSRSLDAQPIVSALRDDRVYAQVQRDWERGSLLGRVVYDRLTFLGTTERVDALLSADVGGTYWVRPTIGVSCGYRILSRQSSLELRSLSYLQHVVRVWLSLAY